jgi:hypothetical protein
VIHELTHALDVATPVKENGLLTTRFENFEDLRHGLSMEFDWLNLSPWQYNGEPTRRIVQTEYTYTYFFEMRNIGTTMTVSNFDGCGSFIDDSLYALENENAPGFINTYARTSPIEDIAESVAYSITSPSLMEKLALNKQLYVMSHILKDRTYQDIISSELVINTGPSAYEICRSEAAKRAGVNAPENPKAASIEAAPIAAPKPAAPKPNVKPSKKPKKKSSSSTSTNQRRQQS